MYKYARIFVYYIIYRTEKQKFRIDKNCIKKNTIKININLKNMLTVTQICDIIKIQKEKGNIKGGQRKK